MSGFPGCNFFGGFQDIVESVCHCVSREEHSVSGVSGGDEVSGVLRCRSFGVPRYRGFMVLWCMGVDVTDSEETVFQ